MTNLRGEDIEALLEMLAAFRAIKNLFGALSMLVTGVMKTP
jgi:hypothetical protein